MILLFNFPKKNKLLHGIRALGLLILYNLNRHLLHPPSTTSSSIHLQPSSRMRLYYCNMSTIHIAENLIFHERTMHIEVDFHLVLQKVMDVKIIDTWYLSSANQLTDLLTKSLGRSRVLFICDKLGMYDVYASAWGRVLRNIRMWRVFYIKVYFIYK